MNWEYTSDTVKMLPSGRYKQRCCVTLLTVRSSEQTTKKKKKSRWKRKPGKKCKWVMQMNISWLIEHESGRFIRMIYLLLKLNAAKHEMAA